MQPIKKQYFLHKYAMAKFENNYFSRTDCNRRRSHLRVDAQICWRFLSQFCWRIFYSLPTDLHEFDKTISS